MPLIIVAVGVALLLLLMLRFELNGFLSLILGSSQKTENKAR
jgi:Gnt-I system high-affinity gluconate transporter